MDGCYKNINYINYTNKLRVNFYIFIYKYIA